MAADPTAAAVVLSGLALSRSVLDRSSHRRVDDRWLAVAWADTRTRVVRVWEGRGEVAGDPPALVPVSPGDVPPDAERYLLGVEPDGTPWFAVRAPHAASPVEAHPAGLRDVGALLGDRDAGVLVHATALEAWHRTHTHCPRCGAPTEPGTGGHVRRCPADGSEHYPRTDPAVIMAVIDDADRVLLGRQARWPERRFSTLAGFVEPGESLERAVAREVWEETGVEVRDARYLGSQPWPFPASLMLGFLAHATTTALRPDGEEIVEARWFSRAELDAAVRTGEVRLPPTVSIARRLVEHWFGGPLRDDGGVWR